MLGVGVCGFKLAGSHSQVCGASAVCSLLRLLGQVYQLPPSANAALPTRSNRPLATLQRAVWSSVPNELTSRPILKLRQQNCCSVGWCGGPFCWDGPVVVTQAGN